MGAYSVFSNSRRVAVKASTAELAVLRIELTNIDSAAHDVEIRRYSSASLSGGTAVAVAALREDSPTPTASAEAATNLSISGTATSFTTVRVPAGGSVTYVFPADFTVSPGSALWLEADTAGGTQVRSTVYHEE